jgi:hypothetical protein
LRRQARAPLLTGTGMGDGRLRTGNEEDVTPTARLLEQLLL